MITVSKEDYLKAILEAECEGEQVIAARLAQWLSVSAPAVTMALRRLKRDRLVSVRQDGRDATRPPRDARSPANSSPAITSSNACCTKYLAWSWYKVHDEAERLEHAVSGDFEALLAAANSGRGGACPHGNAAIPEQPRAKRKTWLAAAVRRLARRPLRRPQHLRARPQAAGISGAQGHSPGQPD